MNASLLLLAAACLPGDTSALDPVPNGPVALTTYSVEEPSKSSGFLGRLKEGWKWKRRGDRLEDSPTSAIAGEHSGLLPCPCTSGPHSRDSAEVVSNQTNASRLTALPAAPATPTVAAAAGDGCQIDQQHEQRTAFADDASWVIGQLSYVHADGGLWLVRYASVDREDRYGGAVVLARGCDMSRFREGDIVFVRGRLVNERRASRYVGGPLYVADTVELNERPTD